jgi:enoyl-CoA hydratase/carnithine racemase
MRRSISHLPVTYEPHGPAAVLTIDRPERRNAIDGPTAQALLDGFERFKADDDAHVLIVTGAGGVAFCAGADLKAIDTLDPDAPGGPLGFTRLHSPKPTIAAIDGWCMAGGFELALWCDLRIASQKSVFAFAERRWGVPLIDGGTQRLPKIIGQGRALELVLTGRHVRADEAREIGLVNEIADDPLHRALALAEELAGFPQDTLLSDRQALLEARGLEREAELGREVLRTAVEGAARFAAGAGRGGAPAE